MMTEKEELVKQLNEIILEFQDSTGIVDYTIILDDRVILSPITTKLDDQSVLDIKKKMDIDDRFKKRSIKMVLLEFEEEIYYFLKGDLNVQVLAISGKENMPKMKESLCKFINDIEEIVDSLKEIPDEHQERIQQSFTTIEDLINKFQIPKFESYKKLVKFASRLK